MSSLNVIEKLPIKKVPGVSTDDEFFYKVQEDQKKYWSGENPLVIATLEKDNILTKDQLSRAIRGAAVLQQAYSLGYYRVDWERLLALTPDVIFKILEIRYNEIKKIYPKIIETWDNAIRKKDRESEK